MTKQEFQQLVENRNIYLDGATGSNLLKSGMPAGVCPEKWILENKEIMMKLQKDYIKAGSNILYAPTFTSNRIKLAEYGLENQIVEINKELVTLTKKVAGNMALVAGDLTMTGQQLEPMGRMKFEDLITVYKEQILILVEAGVDLFVIETMMSLQETRAALLAVKESCNLPVMVTMTFEASGRALFGTDAKTAAIVIESLGADAIGVNCSTGPKQMIPIIEEMRKVVSIPIIAKPNAGIPKLVGDGSTVYDMEVEAFAKEMVDLIEAGASILGGCCGTTPEHISELVKVTSKLRAPNRIKENKRYLTSERQTLAFGLNDNFMIVGERINPTGKKAFQGELREGKIDKALEFAEEQEECGAKILDINMGMSGIDEKAMMLKVIAEVSNQVSLPLAIDSSHIDVIEAALRIYPGRSLINSISLEKEKFDQLLPMAQKYGAMFIILPLSDNGLPKDLAEKKEIIHKIMDRALELGMKKEDIIVDGLVSTVGANKMAAMETLETIRYCKELGLATICGLSNISFGLPERINVNMTFLTLAIQAGLTMAIANPSQELLINAALATDLLLNKEEADMEYIEAMASQKERNMQRTIKEKNIALQNEQMLKVGLVQKDKLKEIKELDKKVESKGKHDLEQKESINLKIEVEQESRENSSKQRSSIETIALKQSSQIDATILSEIKMLVLKGRRNKILELTKQAVAMGEVPAIILNEALLPGINEVGELFERGKYFLPQLISSAETMKIAIEYLEPMLENENSDRNMPTIIIATVAGDIHDIGKNLVALMLKNHGFKVIDLGKDVSKEAIIEAAIEHKATFIALSALMTTTMQEMKYVVDYAKEKGVTAAIIIGGAVITEDYAQEILADGYSKDAAGAVVLVKKILEMMKK